MPPKRRVESYIKTYEREGVYNQIMEYAKVKKPDKFIMSVDKKKDKLFIIFKNPKDYKTENDMLEDIMIYLRPFQKEISTYNIPIEITNKPVFKEKEEQIKKEQTKKEQPKKEQPKKEQPKKRQLTIETMYDDFRQIIEQNHKKVSFVEFGIRLPIKTISTLIHSMLVNADYFNSCGFGISQIYGMTNIILKWMTGTKELYELLKQNNISVDAAADIYGLLFYPFFREVRGFKVYFNIYVQDNIYYPELVYDQPQKKDQTKQPLPENIPGPQIEESDIKNKIDYIADIVKSGVAANNILTKEAFIEFKKEIENKGLISPEEFVSRLQHATPRDVAIMENTLNQMFSRKDGITLEQYQTYKTFIDRIRSSGTDYAKGKRIKQTRKKIMDIDTANKVT